MGYSRRSSGSKVFIWLVVFAIIGVGLWWIFSGDDNGGEYLPIISLTPSSSVIVKWRNELSAGKGEKIANEIKAALDKGSVKKSPELLLLLADSYENAGKNELRLIILQQIIKEYGNSSVAARAREILSRTRGHGIQMFLAGNFSGAFEKFKIDLVKADDKDKPSILWHIGQSAYMLSNLDVAEEYFTKQIADFPESSLTADSYFGLSSVDYDRSDFDGALQNFELGRSITVESAYCVTVAERIFPVLYQEFVVTRKRLSRWNTLREMLCILWKQNEGEERIKIESKLDVLNEYVIFTPTAKCSDSILYTIKPGDSLDRIGKRNGVRHRLISRINSLKTSTIHPNNILKIMQGRANIHISKTDFRLTLLFAGKYIRSYKIGIGKEGKDETPPGEFTITSPEIDPIWYFQDEKFEPGDPRNILGTRWIGLSTPHYGIHGTPDESSLGKKDSAGCIRMRNVDVEEVFDFIRIGDEVIIED